MQARSSPIVKRGPRIDCIILGDSDNISLFRGELEVDKPKFSFQKRPLATPFRSIWVVSSTTVGKHAIVKINILRRELQSPKGGFEEGPK